MEPPSKITQRTCQMNKPTGRSIRNGRWHIIHPFQTPVGIFLQSPGVCSNTIFKLHVKATEGLICHAICTPEIGWTNILIYLNNASPTPRTSARGRICNTPSRVQCHSKIINEQRYLTAAIMTSGHGRRVFFNKRWMMGGAGGMGCRARERYDLSVV